jgi:biopolymer transport protein TolR
MAKKRRLMSEINVVPYIDVMLVLLIIFMITAPLLTQGINVDLPKATANPIENQKDEPLVLSIDRDGRFYLNIGDNTDAPLEDSVVLERVSAVLRRNADTPVLVKGDQSVPYGRVVVGAALLQQAGAGKIGFLTDPKGLEDNRGRRQRR